MNQEAMEGWKGRGKVGSKVVRTIYNRSRGGHWVWDFEKSWVVRLSTLILNLNTTLSSDWKPHFLVNKQFVQQVFFWSFDTYLEFLNLKEYNKTENTIMEIMNIWKNGNVLGTELGSCFSQKKILFENHFAYSS